MYQNNIRNLSAMIARIKTYPEPDRTELLNEYLPALAEQQRLQSIYEVAVELDKDTAGTFIRLPEDERLDLVYRYTMKKILSIEPLDLQRLRKYLIAWYSLKQKDVAERIAKFCPDLLPGSEEYEITEHAMMEEGYQN